MDNQIHSASQTQSQTDPNQAKLTRTAEWVTLDEVEKRFAEEGLIRSRILLARYCRQGRLIGKKDAGPSGDEWFVDPSSIPRAITELKMIRRDQNGAANPNSAEPSQTESNSVKPSQTEFVSARAGAHEENTTDSESQTESNQAKPSLTELNSVKPSQTESDQVRPGQTLYGGDIFEHPYVQRLERKVEQLEDEIQEQVAVTRKIQQDNFQKLIELNQMMQAGQSKTLADLIYRTKHWFLKAGDDPEVGEELTKPAE